jgi:hypothetical protein
MYGSPTQETPQYFHRTAGIIATVMIGFATAAAMKYDRTLADAHASVSLPRAVFSPTSNLSWIMAIASMIDIQS